MKTTRRTFLRTAGTGAAWIALTTALGCEPPAHTRKATPSNTTSPARPKHVLTYDSPSAPPQGAWAFRTRPDLSPPAVDVASEAHDTAPGYIFVAPKRGGPGQHGPMIVDNRGQPVWFRPMQGAKSLAMNFKVQHYKGEPVLTWWVGFYGRQGLDEYVILDRSYREIARIRPGNGRPEGDHHEFLISPQDTALITIYNLIRADLSPVGGPNYGWAYQGIVQEVDIESGEVLFEWHSSEHVGIDESYVEQERPGGPFDYFHINSIDVDHDNNLLVSARRTSAVYKIDRTTGEVIWRLGGKKSDFEMGTGARFASQHDARRQPDGTITIFDNGNMVFIDGKPKVVEESRAIVLELDEEQMSASLVREYTHPHKQFSNTGGSVQVLENGNVFVGWGPEQDFSEFSSDGELLFGASLPPGGASYRAFRFQWSARPSEPPAAAAERISRGKVRVYASWNGATEVTTWEVLAGPSAGQLESLGSVARDGFETTMLVQTSEPYVAVRAKHRSGRVLGTTVPIEL